MIKQLMTLILNNCKMPQQIKLTKKLLHYLLKKQLKELNKICKIRLIKLNMLWRLLVIMIILLQKSRKKCRNYKKKLNKKLEFKSKLKLIILKMNKNLRPELKLINRLKFKLLPLRMLILNQQLKRLLELKKQPLRKLPQLR